MKIYSASAAVQVATQSASTIFYSFTDHNRQPISQSYEVLEKAQRMVDGTMRKFVVAKKKKFEISWNEIPSATYKSASANFNQTSGYPITVDGNPGGAWMRSFYNDNLFKPVRVKIINSQDDWTQNNSSAYIPSTASAGYEEFWAFMENFSYNVVKRYPLTDIVNVSISFVEV